MGKREENKIIIRKRLLQEGQTLFAEKGFEQTTISDIVMACDIAKGTFYNYFSDGKALFDAIIKQLNEEILILVKEARQGETELFGFLYASFKCYFDFVSQEELLAFHRKNQAYIRSTSYGSESLQLIVKDLHKDLKEQQLIHKFQEEQSFQLLSFVLVGTAAESFLNIHATNLKITNHDLATFLAQLFTDGLK
jgi:AcrR family transcriptional regulator